MFRLLHLPRPECHVKYDLDAAYSAAKKFSQDRQWNEALSKRKLHSYVVKANMKRGPCSLTGKLLCGILPLEIETARYKSKKDRIPPKKRLCKLCQKGVVKTEYHFLFSCAPLQAERSAFYVKYVANLPEFMLMPDAMKVRWLLSKDRIKQFAELVEALYFKRRFILYKYQQK